MNATERLGLIQPKIDQAKKHVATLSSDVQRFFDSKPYQVSTRRDSHTRRLEYYVSSLKPVPSTFATSAGDVIQNLRTALDHLAYQLYLVGSPGGGKERSIQFPIGKDALTYTSQRNKTTVGMRSDAITMLDSLQPYKGGIGDKFWVLQELNNADKHRFLIAVGSNFQSINLGKVMTAELNEQTKKMGWETPIIDAYFRPQDTLFPLKEGDALFTDLSAATEKSIDFRFNVGFSVPSVIEKAPLLDTLNDLCDLVNNIVPQFKSCLT